MIGSNYAVTVVQLEDPGAIHPVAHVLFMQTMQEGQPDVIAAIITQLSLKVGLK